MPLVLVFLEDDFASFYVKSVLCHLFVVLDEVQVAQEEALLVLVGCHSPQYRGVRLRRSHLRPQCYLPLLEVLPVQIVEGCELGFQ